MEKTALLIIDMQNDFVLEGRPLKVAGARLVIPKIQAVLGEFRKRSLPVFHVLRVHRADGSDVEITRQDLFRKSPFAVEGTPGAAVIGELEPRSGEYILTKTRMSAFIGTELDLMLRTLGVTRLFVCGIQTPNCIRTTVFDGIAYNYPVVLVDDATGASSEEVHRANVRDMQNIGVRIAKAADVPGLLD
ncbi:MULTISPECIES: cysteine hydrolase family protein [unclassified Methanoregula]|uniref:cysteine hydrolase family protein n=1 Tax=unclassified Methanoregula TaxID=2649730 RepID=UPI0009CB827B|nr:MULTISPECIES: isochorismatase family cysteine hydrolase [unclassified Methanoregula]OPX63162.1 MAG: putative isochorismatase family protein [Methanoregula sp. PtaB.Bin085]OPY33462.1 MAG: putative isochorismatase family protein [Methanoregula sp. PtaU1.Bin006]